MRDGSLLANGEVYSLLSKLEETCRAGVIVAIESGRGRRTSAAAVLRRFMLGVGSGVYLFSLAMGGCGEGGEKSDRSGD